MRAICGTTAEKSVPGLAVPDSVHHVKLVSPRRLPLRCTEISAAGSPRGTSTVSAASSTLDECGAAVAVPALGVVCAACAGGGALFAEGTACTGEGAVRGGGAVLGGGAALGGGV